MALEQFGQVQWLSQSFWLTEKMVAPGCSRIHRRTVSVVMRRTSGLVTQSCVRSPRRLPFTSEKYSGCWRKWSFGLRMASKVWTNGP